MRAHIIENGKVTNTIEVDSLNFMPNLISGETGSIGWLWDGLTLTAPPAPQKTADELQAEARAQRDNLLSECDWVIVMSLEAGRAIPTDLATYRQALRDIPQQAGFPTAIVWPTKP
jgi:hypothetical protein